MVMVSPTSIVHKRWRVPSTGGVSAVIVAGGASDRAMDRIGFGNTT
jgi:hypothetical protein